MQRYVKVTITLVALGLAIIFGGAKCTEHEKLEQNPDGSWTLRGEFHNTADVYARGISFGGKLLDADGNVIAESPGSHPCIDVLSPDASVPFALWFPPTSGQQPVSWVVGTTSGKTLDEPLPDAELRLKDMKATWTSGPGSGLHITGTLVNNSDRTYDEFPEACVAVYDAAGNVIAVTGRSAYGLWLERNIKQATLVRSDTLDSAYEQFVKEKLDALAGLRPRLLTDVTKLPGARILDGQFSAVQQAVGTARKNTAGAAYLRDFVEEAKRSGLVARLIEKHKVKGLSVAPPA